MLIGNEGYLRKVLKGRKMCGYGGGEGMFQAKGKTELMGQEIRDIAGRSKLILSAPLLYFMSIC